MKVDVAPNFDVIVTKTGFTTPQPFNEVAATTSSTPKAADRLPGGHALP